jgi:hypothetical protein
MNMLSSVRPSLLAKYEEWWQKHKNSNYLSYKIAWIAGYEKAKADMRKSKESVNGKDNQRN